ncbi:hypothetical protein POM88_021655 [Heracleum sosnowskyi]|uniref:Uncharacterized protein n=1 Tax=Heracleum sosnowskyi TaxID=360622 RepID=A0AAD8IHA3_9APIA|nr:hypothetical protein POM88_021655 [Heracleum sosnowskyi]
MTDSQPVESEGDNLPTFIRRNNLYFSNKNTLSKSINEEVAKEKSIIKKAEKRVKMFPPLLPSLNRNGRPKYSLESVRREGRLQMWIVPNHYLEVVRTCQDGDRVSMELLETGQR